jgi:indolepyruvate ferredoxin oxidoreductase alpha subunit
MLERSGVVRQKRIMMGNEAIARGLVEQGCTLAASYPGTPASEILSAFTLFAHELGADLHSEWSVNEKIAYEVALAHSYAGKRAAVAMKQVGLNVAADPIMRSAYLGVAGGLVIVAADDPGPHSSQTEQDSRFFAHLARIPVLDPISPRDAREMTALAYELSESYQLPVILRPTTRVCHARQDVECSDRVPLERKAAFTRDPSRWAATPHHVTRLHALLNEKLKQLALDERCAPQRIGGGGQSTCIIGSGVVFAHALELVQELGLADAVDLYRVVMPYPLNIPFITMAAEQYRRILILEESYPVIEMQLAHAGADGRASGAIPSHGELIPEVIESALRGFFSLPDAATARPPEETKPPSLCPGCAHRAAFFAIKQAFPKAIMPGDIGCYTLGINLDAVDTCHCMGAGISQAAGFYHAFRQDHVVIPPIFATIGDSTFFHAGIPALINAVIQGARFVVVILDNSTTAMTGFQPPPHSAVKADGTPAIPVHIPEIVRACGVGFVEECDPVDFVSFTACLLEAVAYTRNDRGGMAVVIAKHPCVLRVPEPKRQRVEVSAACTGCRECVEHFECPALIFKLVSIPAVRGRVEIDEKVCTGCGLCVHACKRGAIQAVLA